VDSHSVLKSLLIRELLAEEKAAMRANDALNSKLRDFPMVKVDKIYTFDGPNGSKVKLADLFEGRKQLIVYHFMLAPDDEVGCSGCSFVADNFPKTAAHLNSRDTSLAMVSRAPLPKIESFKAKMGWTEPWVSSFNSDFNYDFGATRDQTVTPMLTSSFQNTETLANEKPSIKGENPGLAVFFKDGDTIYHTYSAFESGVDRLLVTQHLLDLTPLGQQDEDGMDWKLHYEY